MKPRKRNVSMCAAAEPVRWLLLIAAFFSLFSLFSCEKAKDTILANDMICKIPTTCKKIASVSIGKSKSLYVVTVLCKGQEEVAYSNSFLMRPRTIKFKRENREDMTCKKVE